jgi:hypothetical protein
MRTARSSTIQRRAKECAVIEDPVGKNKTLHLLPRRENPKHATSKGRRTAIARNAVVGH